ncbi:MAG: Phosphoesterase PA-phosphatase related protein [Candidatus Shapirobacteria bacterium GW2011_GWE1_38_10]|uniref:Phosphoesterase PA-phosphatase related protein n=1 Tax=Candidatus Shapirobacteria bacterium GW2011_GWE1_38_10 TaxID=1618488 RepID=A0A0G0I2V3_9BACT|nr:MAG: Phosphoesterase PA-phosphatase related protein [Candidatus Shapirobacteria bacterium GW2011_GWF2_37_20]KKQ49633.1 MAG: Phosphoesterase PA-phosphatase related protein [Candidatus Shapirobacteria bacterium GW2011_GWE1_38_10]KKQ64611.1 MAG: Phosphoesterase PA-phosphatase related protein [Candidatus Shapirobacteria bacterium GW2011_GWF1_38_23]
MVLVLDQQIANLFYSWRSPILTGIMIFITNLGSTLIIVVLGLVIFWLISRRDLKKEAWRFLMTLSGGAIMNNLLKEIIKRPRPLLISPLVNETTYSFPSGHTMNATVLYLLIVFYIFKFLKGNRFKWVYASSLMCLVVLIGMSRIYLGVHSPSDVVAGFLAGVLWLITVVLVEKLMTLAKKRRSVK